MQINTRRQIRPHKSACFFREAGVKIMEIKALSLSDITGGSADKSGGRVTGFRGCHPAALLWVIVGHLA